MASLRNNFSREGEHQFIKRTFPEEVPLDISGRWVTSFIIGGGELFSKSFCYIYVVSEGFGGKSDRLIGRSFAMFAGKLFNNASQACRYTSESKIK